MHERSPSRPLIVFTPKSLLHHLLAVSRGDELAGGGFREVIGETGPIESERVTRVLFSAGKIYWHLRDVLACYPLTAEAAWVQEV